MNQGNPPSPESKTNNTRLTFILIHLALGIIVGIWIGITSTVHQGIILGIIYGLSSTFGIFFTLTICNPFTLENPNT